MTFPPKCNSCISKQAHADLAQNWKYMSADVALDFQVLVRISDLAVIAGEARPLQIAEALAWARDHQEMLALKWAELNERD